MDRQNLTLMTDLYELTMMQGYFKSENDKTVVFDMFYRTNPSGGGYAIAAGLEQVIEYIKELYNSNHQKYTNVEEHPNNDNLTATLQIKKTGLTNHKLARSLFFT